MLHIYSPQLPKTFIMSLLVVNFLHACYLDMLSFACHIVTEIVTLMDLTSVIRLYHRALADINIGSIIS